MHHFTNPEETTQTVSFKSKSFALKLKSFKNKQISQYILKQKIGQGSYAKVYKAIHKLTKQIVACKVLCKAKMTVQEIQKAYKEVQTHKKLLHQNIARIYEFFQNQEKMYIFMEFCPNGELFNYINNKGPLSQKFASKIFKQILSAMKYMKNQRIFHRDIKCENILFDQYWNAKLVDFGFVTKQQQDMMSETFCGSPSYTSPQLSKRLKYHSQFIDIWCLGVTLYAMLAGQLPFDAKDSKYTRKNIIEINYQIKKQFSEKVQQVFKGIFVEEKRRLNIEGIQGLDFYKQINIVQPHFIDTNTDQLKLDSQVLQVLTQQYGVNQLNVIESVSKFKLDQNFANYYLVAHQLLAKGQPIKYDIESPNFTKIKKRNNTLKLIKIKNYSRLVSDQKKVKKVQNKYQKDLFRIRASNPSIDVNNCRLRKRDDSPQSPKRILDLVSAYRKL